MANTVGHCVALQVKSGVSYRRHNSYAIPVGHHADSWRESTVPVFGVAFDPEIDALHWADLTGYLREHPDLCSGSVPVPKHQVLNAKGFPQFCEAVAVYRQARTGSLVLNLLSASSVRQAEALNDAWAMGRRDARYLIVFRRLLLDLPRQATRWCIWRLSHLASNPDIYYTKETWLPLTIQEQLRQTFRWSTEELAHLAGSIDPEEWGRGTLGQCLDTLVGNDPDFLRHSTDAAEILFKSGNVEEALQLLLLALSHSPDPRAHFQMQCARFPVLNMQTWASEVTCALQEENQFSLY